MTQPHTDIRPGRISVRPMLLFLAVFGMAVLLLIWRAPGPMFFPDLYAEDGQDYLVLLQVQEHGRLGAFLHLALKRHDGFLMVGNAVLAQVAVLLDVWVWKGDPADLPRAMSLVSYGFLAAIFGYTAVLFEKRTRLVTTCLTCAWLCLLPLPRSPELVLGRISNCGLLFFFLALLITLHRTLYARTPATAIACDLAFVICVYSNPVVLLLLPFLYAPQVTALCRDRGHIMRAENISAICAVVLCGLCAMASLRGNILTPASYMKTPFIWKSGIELILGRLILFPVIHPIYRYLTDAIVLVIAAVAAFGTLKVAIRASVRDRWWYAVVAFGLLSFTLATAVFRPGITWWFQKYDWRPLSHPEFFYVENYLAILLTALLVHDLVQRFRPMARAGVAALSALFVTVTGFAAQSSAVGPWNLYLGTFEQQLERQYWARSYANDYDALSENGNFVRVPTAPYPHITFDGTIQFRWWTVLIPREDLRRSRVARGTYQGTVSETAPRTALNPWAGGRAPAPAVGVTQSSTCFGGGPERAVDARTDGHFYAGSVTQTCFEKSPWWQVDLGLTQTIRSVTIWNRTDCCSDRLADYWLFLSETPFTQSDSPETLLKRPGTWSTHQTAAPDPRANIPAPGIKARYVRVQLSGISHLSLAEIQVN